MMILSSTTSPKTSTIPIVEIKLIVSPANPRKATVPKSVTGMLIATQNAVFKERNKPRTTIISARPTRALFMTMFNLLETDFDLSLVTIKLSSEGYVSFSEFKVSLTFSTVLITSAFSVFVTLRI